MKAVILAAGKGTRIPEITRDIPKCLIEVQGKTILERQLAMLLKNSFKKIYVVIGYKAELIRKKISYNSKIKFILNKDYATTDNIYSLFLTRDKIKDEAFLLLNGDILCEEKIIKKLVENESVDIAPVDTKYFDSEKLKIKVENNRVLGILPKNAPKYMSDGSTIGIFKFSSNGSKILFDEIEKCIKSGEKNRWFEFALTRICKQIDMQVLDIHGMKWVEIDDLMDLKKAQKIFGG